jgi:DNA-binding cell septation regulator SpoVG
MDVEVVKLKIINKGKLKAFVSIKAGAVTIHDLLVVQQPAQAAWVSMPQKEVQINGERRFFPIVEIEKESPFLRRVEQVVVTAWQKEAKQQGAPESSGDNDTLF